MAMPIGSTRMVNIVGEMPTADGRGVLRVPISREFREWLIALWRRTGGDADDVSDAESMASTAVNMLPRLMARIAALEERVQSLEQARTTQRIRVEHDSAPMQKSSRLW